jgi:hypothetical protein
MTYTEEQIDAALVFAKAAYFQGYTYTKDGLSSSCKGPGVFPHFDELLKHPERYKLRPAPRMIQLWEFHEVADKWVPASHAEVGGDLHMAREKNSHYRKLGSPIPYPGDAE